MNHRAAIVTGVVRHEVNTSAGYRGFRGSVSSARQAARTMLPDVSIDTIELFTDKAVTENKMSAYAQQVQYRSESVGSPELSLLLFSPKWPLPSPDCCFAESTKNGSTMPAPEQSIT